MAGIKTMHYHRIAPNVTDAEREAFLQRLPLVMVEAQRLGLVITGRALHDAVRASGWEYAGNTTKAAEFVSAIV